MSSQDLSFPPPIPVSEPPNTARFLSSIKFSLPEAYLLGVLPSERDPKPGNLEHPEPLISRKLARKHVLLPTWDGFQGAEPQSGLALCIRGLSVSFFNRYAPDSPSPHRTGLRVQVEESVSVCRAQGPCACEAQTSPSSRSLQRSSPK